MLPLKYVSVIIANRLEETPPDFQVYQSAQLRQQIGSVRWSLNKKREVSDHLRRTLLDPNGAEVVEQTPASRAELL